MWLDMEDIPCPGWWLQGCLPYRAGVRINSWGQKLPRASEFKERMEKQKEIG